MPTGVMEWYEPGSRRGRVRRCGRRFPVRGEVERDAQVAGARVHFDIEHEGGVEWATNITLRRGTRVARVQHRFGDLGGHRSHGASVRTPGTVADLWLHAIATADISMAEQLYAPDAALRRNEEVSIGLIEIWRTLERWGLLGRPLPGATVSFPDEHTAVIAWAGGPDVGAGETSISILHGEIFDQRLTS